MTKKRVLGKELKLRITSIDKIPVQMRERDFSMINQARQGTTTGITQ